MPQIGSDSGVHKIEDHVQKHSLKYMLGTFAVAVALATQLSGSVASIMGFATSEQLRYVQKENKELRQIIADQAAQLATLSSGYANLKENQDRHEQDIRELRH